MIRLNSGRFKKVAGLASDIEFGFYQEEHNLYYFINDDNEIVIDLNGQDPTYSTSGTLFFDDRLLKIFDRIKSNHKDVMELIEKLEKDGGFEILGLDLEVMSKFRSKVHCYVELYESNKLRVVFGDMLDEYCYYIIEPHFLKSSFFQHINIDDSKKELSDKFMELFNSHVGIKVTNG